MHELHQEFSTTLAAIAWHTGDVLEFPESADRTNMYGVTGFPTVKFDGIEEVVGGYQPSSYPYYLPVFEERMITPVNFVIDMEISNSDATDYNVSSSIEILEGFNEENLAAFVVVTETDLVVPNENDQIFVARSVWPDATVGHQLDFSNQTVHEINTTVTLEDDYVFENCEVIVFLQNMDTWEIYQGTSMMMSEITNYQPATDLTYELEDSDIIFNWVEPVSDGLMGYNVYHAFDGGDFEVLEFVEETTYTHVEPNWGLHQYYVTAVYLSGESEPSNTVEILLTSIGEDISSKIEIYPNPASQRITINSAYNIDQFEIYNHVGQRVKQNKTGSNSINFNISELEPGIYFIKVFSHDQIITKKLVIK